MSLKTLKIRDWPWPKGVPKMRIFTPDDDAPMEEITAEDLENMPDPEEVQIEDPVLLDADSIPLQGDLEFNGHILHEPNITIEESNADVETFQVMPARLNYVHVMHDGRAQRSSVNVTINELGKQLLNCAREGDQDGIRSLMGKGAPFTSDFLGTSALHLAAQYNHIGTAELLLRAGISRDARTKVDKTPLHIAATEGNVIIVQLLLSYGAEVNAKDMLRMTPLHWAVDRGHIDTIRVLLESGGSTTTVSKFDKSPYEIAKDYNRMDIIDLMHSIEVVISEIGPGDFEGDAEDATLAATRSIALEMGLPPVMHQEEVETSEVDGNFEEDFLATKEIVAEQMGQPSTSSEAMARSKATMQILHAHGITMLPIEENTLVESAMESGQTIVLTEAGKLALGHGHGHSHSQRKLKRAPTKKKLSHHVAIAVAENYRPRTNPLTKSSVVPKGKPVYVRKYRAANIPQKKIVALPRVHGHSQEQHRETDSSKCSMEAIQSMLNEAVLAAQHHKELALQKEKEAETYRQKMLSMKRKRP